MAVSAPMLRLADQVLTGRARVVASFVAQALGLYGFADGPPAQQETHARL